MSPGPTSSRASRACPGLQSSPWSGTSPHSQWGSCARKLGLSLSRDSDSATPSASVPTLPSSAPAQPTQQSQPFSSHKTRSATVSANHTSTQEMSLTPVGRRILESRGGRPQRLLAQAATAHPPTQVFTPYQEQLPGYASPELQIFLGSVEYKPRNGVQKEISPRTATCTQKENCEHPQNLHKTPITSKSQSYKLHSDSPGTVSSINWTLHSTKKLEGLHQSHCCSPPPFPRSQTLMWKVRS